MLATNRKRIGIALVSATLSLFGQLASAQNLEAKTFFEVIPRPENQGWILAQRSSIDARLYRQADVPVSRYTELPRKATLELSATDQRRALHWVLDLPAALVSYDPWKTELPQGAEMIDGSIVNSSVVLNVQESWTKWIDSVRERYDSAVVSYESRSEQSRWPKLVELKLATTETPAIVDALVKAHRAALNSGKALRVNVVLPKGSSFAQSELASLLAEAPFTYEVSEIALERKTERFVQAVPFSGDWAKERKPLVFYKALELLDTEWIPFMESRGVLRGLSDVVPESVWRRQLLQDGYDLYFTHEDKCGEYEVSWLNEDTRLAAGISIQLLRPQMGSISVKLQAKTVGGWQ